MKDNGPWLAIAGIGAMAVAAALAYSLVAPYWDQGETSALLGAIVLCPSLGVLLGGVFLGLHWRDERIAAREEKQASKRGQAIGRHAEDANILGLNAAVTRQAIDVISAMAQAQARQAAAQLGGLRADQFIARAIDAPTQEPSWFAGDWDYGNETEEAVEATGGVRYL